MNLRQTCTLVTVVLITSLPASLDVDARNYTNLPSRYKYVIGHCAADSIVNAATDLDSIDPMRVREPDEIIGTFEDVTSPMTWNPYLSPLTLYGYMPPPAERVKFRFDPLKSFNTAADTVSESGATDVKSPATAPKQWSVYTAAELSRKAAWLRHNYMINNPEKIEYAEWMLPLPPELPEDDHSFNAYVKRLVLPKVNTSNAYLKPRTINKIHWLHTLNTSVQFSQAYLSKNWYQGGNDYLALLINLYWNVKLNPAYHPNVLFENTVSYKLGLNSNQHDEYHKYSISEDLFQWNMNLGIKALKKWYYSLTYQFKTQILNSYPQNSLTRTASFLSPGELNFGLGMTYSTVNKKKTISFKAAISPVSYNLKTCIDTNVDPSQFGISAGQRSLSEIGSSSELTLNWNMTPDISWKSRMFIFSDYKQYAHDWENTFSFTLNRFLSTQVYVHLRYDTAANTHDSRWKHLMLKEILSFGFAYTFSTK